MQGTRGPPSPTDNQGGMMSLPVPCLESNWKKRATSELRTARVLGSLGRIGVLQPASTIQMFLLETAVARQVYGMPTVGAGHFHSYRRTWTSPRCYCRLALPLPSFGPSPRSRLAPSAGMRNHEASLSRLAMDRKSYLHFCARVHLHGTCSESPRCDINAAVSSGQSSAMASWSHDNR